MMKAQTIRLAPQRIEARFAAERANKESRTVPVTFYTGATVRQFTWQNGLHNLTMEMNPAHVDMSRFASGAAPFTRGHSDPNDPGAVIGTIIQASLDREAGTAVVRFSKRADVEPVYQDVLDGILRNVSVEAIIHRMKEVTKTGDAIRSFVATKWEPTALALVAQGADPGARINAAAEVETEVEVEFALGASAPKESDMEKTNNSGTMQPAGAVTLSEAEQATIRTRVQVAKLPAEFANDLIARNMGPNEATTAIFNRLADQSEVNATRTHAGVTRDHREGLVDRMSEALACRYTGKAPSDGAREFVGASIADLARVCCQNAGIHVTGFGAERYIKMAMNHTTSDFPELLQGTGRRMLLDAYQATRPAIQRVARRSTAQDFRTKSALRLGGAPKLIKVPESGEVTHGTRAEAKESYRIYTFGRIFGITREGLVNDDLGAFNDFARAYGIAAANLEGQELVDLLASNPTMTDTKALFHSDHANLNAAPGAISDTTLSAGRLALRTATDLDGETIIETVPRYLVVPAALENVAEKYLAGIYPAEAANVNPFSGKLELIVEPRLDGKSATGWYLFGDPSQAPVLEYSYLSGAEGLQVDSRAGFEVLGMEFRAVLDYGVGAIGWRGCWKGNN